ncbi:hypothetical protein AAG906_022675 [Vitis piasezkii]
MHLHIYDYALQQIPYEERIYHACGPYSDSTKESSYKEGQYFRARAPRDSQATPIADREHFMSRHILITLFCDSSLSCGIHTAYLRGTILYPL